MDHWVDQWIEEADRFYETHSIGILLKPSLDLQRMDTKYRDQIWELRPREEATTQIYIAVRNIETGDKDGWHLHHIGEILAMQCAECDGFVQGIDYLCEKCR